MIAACAAIWLAVSEGPGEETCERLEVFAEGSVGSNNPCVAECFLWWLFVNGDDDEPCLGVAPGLEKFWCCKLAELELANCV